jgi:formylglycine-generating enzyme required for sulfatase activity
MGSNPSTFKGDDLPVEQVTWDEAMEFCRKLTERERAANRLPAGYGYTLPTEAQWEYACRAGTTGDYAGDLDAMAWYDKNSGGTPHPVGTKRANAWGLADMHGNVCERCLDWYDDKYRGGEVTNPRGPASGSFRVLRGGGWSFDALGVRSAVRFSGSPGSRGDDLGFRLALSAVR